MSASGNTAASEWRSYWSLPLAAALGYSTAVLHTYAIGPFMASLQQEFAWSRAQLSVGITIAGLVGAAFSVPMGMLVDRLGPRLVGLIGVLLMTAAFALLGYRDGRHGELAPVVEPRRIRKSLAAGDGLDKRRRHSL